MKDDDKIVVAKAMSFIITNMDVDDKFISIFKEKDIFDEQSIDDIMVRQEILNTNCTLV